MLDIKTGAEDICCVETYLANANYRELIDEFEIYVVHPEQNEDAFDPLFRADVWVEDTIVFDPEWSNEEVVQFGEVMAEYDGNPLDPTAFDFTISTDATGVTVFRDQDGVPALLLSGDLSAGTIAGLITVSPANDSSINYVTDFSIELVDSTTLTVPSLNETLPTEDKVVTVGDSFTVDYPTFAGTADEGWDANVSISDWSPAEVTEDDGEKITIVAMNRGVTEIEYSVRYGNDQYTHSKQRLIVCEEGETADDVLADWENGGEESPIHINIYETVVMNDNDDYFNIGSVDPVVIDGAMISPSDVTVTIGELNISSVTVSAVAREEFYELMMSRGTGYADGDTCEVDVSVTASVEGIGSVTKTENVKVYTTNSLQCPTYGTLPTDDLILNVNETYTLETIALDTTNAAPSGEWSVHHSIRNVWVDETDSNGAQTITPREISNGEIVFELQFNGYRVKDIGSRRFFAIAEGADKTAFDPNWDPDIAFMGTVIVGPDITSDNLYAGQIHEIYYNGVRVYPDKDFTYSIVTSESGIGYIKDSYECPTMYLDNQPTAGTNLRVTVTLTPTSTGSIPNAKPYTASGTMKITHQDDLTVPSPTVDTTAISLNVGETATITLPVITDQAQKDIGWQFGQRSSVSNDAFDVNHEGNTVTITAKNAGTGSFTYMADCWNYHVAIGTRSITVTDPAQTASVMSLMSSEPELGGVSDDTVGGEGEQPELGTVTPSEAE